jgi:L-ornithine N5-monooxygenase
MADQHVDILGIGAGPANLSLAVAFEEFEAPRLAGRMLLLEQQRDIQWQRGLLMPWTESQVSFVKDLVTLRNPRSRFTFLNYLFEQGRLSEFANLGTLTPYRIEISGYLQWVADSLSDVKVEYGQRCVSIKPELDADGTIVGWAAHLQDGTVVVTRDIVIGIGRDPHVPEVFTDLPQEWVIHSSEYLNRIGQLAKDLPHRVVVIGGAQSAAEMFRAVHDDLPHSSPTIIMRSVGLGYYQTSKFINELYYPSFVSEFFEADADYRRQILHEMRQTNYAGLAPGMLEELYRMLYIQRLVGHRRSRVMTMTEVVRARVDGNEVVLDLRNRCTGGVTEFRCDVVLLGTGFQQRMPALVRDLAGAIGEPELRVCRDYRLLLSRPSTCAVYLQGVNEDSHGISDTLLSVVADRSAQIINDIAARRAQSGADLQALVLPAGSTRA